MNVMKMSKPPEVQEWEVVDTTGETGPQRCWYRSTAVDLARLLTMRGDPPGRFRVRRVRRVRQEPQP